MYVSHALQVAHNAAVILIVKHVIIKRVIDCKITNALVVQWNVKLAKKTILKNADRAQFSSH